MIDNTATEKAIGKDNYIWENIGRFIKEMNKTAF